MAILIGTDEAGYGPNLGPMIVSATVWHVDDEAIHADLYHLLSRSVSDGSPSEEPKLQIADSKRLYKPGHGLRSLETNVVAALRILRHQVGSWGSLFAALDPFAVEQFGDVPWYSRYECRVPVEASEADMDAVVHLAQTDWPQQGVRLVTLRSTVIFPKAFNQLVTEYGTKGAALSHITLQLVADMVNAHAVGPMIINCDKHGGRNRYYALLQHFFSSQRIRVVTESRAASVYRWGQGSRETECRFVANGERFLPSALASMVSKYLRELAMKAFNAYWQEHVPGIRPTAGYPLDAKRFKREIAAEQQRLGIPETTLWRSR